MIGDNGIWYAFRKIGHKVVRVVVKGEQKPYTVITMYYDRRLRKAMIAEERKEDSK